MEQQRHLIIDLNGAMSSWGEQSIGDDRMSLDHPTASAAIGLVGACAGIDKRDKLAQRIWYESWDVITASAILLKTDGGHISAQTIRDFQATQNALQMDGKRCAHNIVSSRGYLIGGRQAAIMTLRPNAKKNLMTLAVGGLNRPCYTPYLGRKCNPLGSQALAGVICTTSECEMMQALLSALQKPGYLNSPLVMKQLRVQCNRGSLSQWISHLSTIPSLKVQLNKGHNFDQRQGHIGCHSRRDIDDICVRWVQACENLDSKVKAVSHAG